MTWKLSKPLMIGRASSLSQAENRVDISMEKEVGIESIVVDEAVDNEQERVEPQAESEEPAPQKQI